MEAPLPPRTHLSLWPVLVPRAFHVYLRRRAQADICLQISKDGKNRRAIPVSLSPNGKSSRDSGDQDCKKLLPPFDKSLSAPLMSDLGQTHISLYRPVSDTHCWRLRLCSELSPIVPMFLRLPLTTDVVEQFSKLATRLKLPRKALSKRSFETPEDEFDDSNRGSRTA